MPILAGTLVGYIGTLRETGVFGLSEKWEIWGWNIQPKHA